MINKFQKIIRQAIKDYEITSLLPNEDTLVTLLTADLYKATVVQTVNDAAAQTPRPSRRPGGSNGAQPA